MGIEPVLCICVCIKLSMVIQFYTNTNLDASVNEAYDRCCYLQISDASPDDPPRGHALHHAFQVTVSLCWRLCLIRAQNLVPRLQLLESGAIFQDFIYRSLVAALQFVDHTFRHAESAIQNYSVACPGFSAWGANAKRGARTYYFAKLSGKLHGNKITFQQDA